MDEANGTTRTIVKRTRRRGRMGDMRAYREGDEDEDGPAASTPAEAAMKMLKKRGYSKKINYDALKKLYEPSPPSTPTTNTKNPTSSTSSTRVNSRESSHAPSPPGNSNIPNTFTAPKSTIAKPPPGPATKMVPQTKPAVIAVASNTKLPLSSKNTALSPTPPIKLQASGTSPLTATFKAHPKISTATATAPSIPNDDHEDDDSDFWDEGELERVQGEIETRLNNEDVANDDDEDPDDDDDDMVVNDIEEEYEGEEYD